MLTDDELTALAETALARVGARQPVNRHPDGCHVHHLDIARVAIEEGLKLALRLLREQCELPAAPQLGRSAVERAPIER